MKYPLWSQDQFIDATSPGGLNPAAGVVSGSIVSVGNAVWALPGLLAPEAMTVAFSGMTATIGLPSPWGLLTSGGIVVRAHGTQTGADTQNYSVNFASLVPGSGSLTAYLAATVTTIQQGPVPIPGPPPGHPAYDPTFVPAVGYTNTAYSVALAAVSGGIDNVNTFELLRTTLTAGQTSLTAYNTAGQYRAPDRDAWPASTLTSGGTLVPGQAQTMQVFGASGVTVTLPPASGAGGLMFGFVNPLAVTGTVATTGTDVIVGFGATQSSINIPASGAVLLWAEANTGGSGQYQAVGASPNVSQVPVGTLLDFAGTNAPDGYLLCYGQAISRTSYAALFATLGTAWGVGDGSTTFNIPDLRGRATFGADAMGGSAAGRLTSASISVSANVGAVGGSQYTQTHTHTVTDPAHTHGITDPGHMHAVGVPGNTSAPQGTNAGSLTAVGSWTGGNTNTAYTSIVVGANFTGISNQTYGAGGQQNVPPAGVVNKIIFTGVF